MKISSQFDSGNIKVIDASDSNNIQLQINKDNDSDFYQWFHFRVTGARETELTLHITNAEHSAYADGWPDYQAMASYDRDTWFRVDTEYQNKQLTIKHTPMFDSVYYAYFVPYSLDRHANLIAEALMSPLTSTEVLGQTLDGRDLDLLKIGDDEQGKKNIWIIARQHPGESMAEWCVEGLIERLLNPHDAIAEKILEQANFYIIPNMNPDGSFRGHLRTNACGANLNREWNDSSMQRSPEVHLTKQKMQAVGVDFVLDVHGDEAIPYNFIAGAEGVPSWNENRQQELDFYKNTLQSLTPYFQTQRGYEVDEPGKADLRIATNWHAENFGCLAMTLEMPFKNLAAETDQPYVWDGERCREFGAVNLAAIYQWLNR